jgi:hypothetical protein
MLRLRGTEQVDERGRLRVRRELQGKPHRSLLRRRGEELSALLRYGLTKSCVPPEGGEKHAGLKGRPVCYAKLSIIAEEEDGEKERREMR